MDHPKVSFIYAFPLDQGRRKFYEENDLGEYPTIQEIKDTIKVWKEVWNKVEQEHQVIEKLIELTGRVPGRSLECFVFGAGLNTMSTPFLMPLLNRKGKKRSKEFFVETMIHELLHIFITSNTGEYWKMVEEKYANEEVACRNHILVYAMLYKLCKELFNSEPIDFPRDDLPPGYLRAITLVKEIGHEVLIEEYRSLT